MVWKALIVDDEAPARELLSGLINTYCKSLELVGEAASVQEAILIIAKHQPDVVFLDVEMPQAHGFELLRLIPNPNFAVIFTTAYNHYAVEAIRFSALDFLQKPIAVEELISAVQRFQNSKEAADNALQKIEVLLNNVNEQRSSQKIIVPETGGFTAVDGDDILYLKADKNYTDLFLQNNVRITSSKPIRHYEELLPSDAFYRVSQSFIIRLAAIHRYRKGEGGTVTMSDGFEIDIPRRKKQEFLRLFG